MFIYSVSGEYKCVRERYTYNDYQELVYSYIT